MVVTGEGKHFMAGGDLGLFRENLLARKPVVSMEMFADIRGAIADIRALPKPVVDSVRGAVAGFGLSLMSACDLVVAADCVFTAACCTVGLSPDGGGTYFLPRMVGMKRAMELPLLGGTFQRRASVVRLGICMEDN